MTAKQLEEIKRAQKHRVSAEELLKKERLRIGEVAAFKKYGGDRAKLNLGGKRLSESTYAVLSRLRAMENYCSIFMQRLREAFKALESLSAGQHQFQFCFCVDRSPSMGGDKGQQALTALVLCMESFRRLEIPFSIAHFGGVNDQKIAKYIDEPMSPELGQTVLQQFNWNSAFGTRLAEGLKFALIHGFKGKNTGESFAPYASHVQLHRVVIVLTDGLTRHIDHTDGTNMVAEMPKNCDIGFVQIADADQEQSKTIVDSLQSFLPVFQSSDFVTVFENQVELLPPLLANLVSAKINDVAQRIHQTQRGAARQERPPPAWSAAMLATLPRAVLLQPSSEECSRTVRQLNLAVPEEVNVRALIGASAPDGKLSAAQLKAAHQLESLRLQRSAQLRQLLSDLRVQLQDQYRAVESGASSLGLLRESEQAWHDATSRLSPAVSSLVEVLLEQLMPITRYTRFRPNTKGSKLNLRGVIRFIMTNGGYKKIFATAAAGGKREHAFCIVLDQSASMSGSPSIIAHECAVAFIAALVACGHTNFSVVSFASQVVVLKTEQQAWSATAMHHFLTQPAAAGATVDAEAVEVATQLLAGSSVKGRRYALVFSDGYSQNSRTMASALHSADQAGITVLGVGAGLDSTNVAQVFPNWVTVPLVSCFADALRRWHSGQGEGQLVQREQSQLSLAAAGGGGEQNIDDVWRVHVNAEEMKEERDMLVDTTESAGATQNVDLCFLIDTTISMGPWIDGARQHALRLAEFVRTSTDRMCRGRRTKLRMSFISYKDVYPGGSRDPGHLDFVPLMGPTDEEWKRMKKGEQVECAGWAAVKAKIGSAQAEGGGDVPEDLVGGLDKAAGLDWVKEGAKVLVVIADAPCHGHAYHDLKSQPTSFYNVCAGQSQIAGAQVDAHKNAMGAEFDLAKDGAYKGFTVLVLQAHSHPIPEPLAALGRKGFQIMMSQSEDEFMKWMDDKNINADCAWVISCQTRPHPELASALHAFHRRGKGLFIFGDNYPFYTHANAFLHQFQTSLHDNYPGMQQVRVVKGWNGSGAGFGEHPIFTGIQHFYEGNTICHIQSTNPALKIIANNSEGKPLVGVFDSIPDAKWNPIAKDTGVGRIIIDCGLTKLFSEFFDGAGTSRYIVNATAWLIGVERGHPRIKVDNWPEGVEGGPKVPAVLRSLAAQNVSILFTKLNKSTDKMLEQFNAELRAAAPDRYAKDSQPIRPLNLEGLSDSQVGEMFEKVIGKEIVSIIQDESQ